MSWDNLVYDIMAITKPTHPSHNNIQEKDKYGVKRDKNMKGAWSREMQGHDQKDSDNLKGITTNLVKHIYLNGPSNKDK